MGSTRDRRFDIFSFGFKGAEDETGILRSKDEVEKLIAQEVDAGLPANRIVVGGFSQGGAITLATGLTTSRQLAGLTVLSGWFPIMDKIKVVCRDGFTPVTEKFDVFGSFSDRQPLTLPSSGDTVKVIHWSHCRSEDCPRKKSRILG